MKKIAALALALVMVCLALASCGAPKVTANCKISFIIDGEYILQEFPVEAVGTEENPPTVLQAAREALQMVEYNYALDDEELGFSSVSYDGVDYTTGIDADGNICYWGYTVNGEEPEKGRAGSNAVLEGQNIVFTYICEAID